MITVGLVARFSMPATQPRDPESPLARREWPAIVVLTLCAALVMVSLTAARIPHDPGRRIILAWLVLAIPILLLRRWPLPVLAAATLANALIFTTGLASLPFGLILGAASYLAAARLPRRVSIRAVAVSAAALGAALVYTTLAVRSAALASQAVEGFLPLAAGWVAGDSVAARRRYLAGLAEQARREQAAEAERARLHVREERVRIARELHDVVAHTLAVITVQAGVGRRLMARDPAEASAALESIETIGRTAQEELRVVLGLLREEENRTPALTPAPKLLDIKALAETVQASGTPVTLHMSGHDRPLSPALELSIYRVVQEALTNVVKHAPGAHATVDLTVADYEIHLTITDTGAPVPTQESTGQGHGIVGMRERISAFGGQLEAWPLPGGGFRVTARVPIEGAV
jgi:signal transduction histidine kinase